MLAIVSLTKGGASLATEIKKYYPDANFFGKQVAEGSQESIPGRFTDWIAEHFHYYDQWIFIMATGIVVRAIADLLIHKSKDPAVVVMDEKGNFAIPLVSGHLGGANDLARELAEKIKAIPVITTASDVRGVVSVDELAKHNNLLLCDYEGAKRVTADLVNGKGIGVFARQPIQAKIPAPYQLFVGDQGWRTMEEKLRNGEISCFLYIGDESVSFPYSFVQLYPRNLIVGIGCRKGTDLSVIEAGLSNMMDLAGFTSKGIGAVATAWVKAEEPGILKLADRLQATMQIFTHDEIKNVSNQFDGSDFVEKTIGVSCVSEPCGYLGSERGECLVPIVRKHGMTLSLWRKLEEIK